MEEQLSSIASRLEQEMSDARMRILVVGAGIAGATLGALLRQRGERPAIIERGTGKEDGGYMLGLMPLGGRVLNGLGLAETCHQVSLPMRNYAMYNRNGRLIKNYPLAPLVERFGAVRGIERGKLLDMLRNVAGPILYDTSIVRVDETDDRVLVTFNDGSSADFDLVVAADGAHSSLRELAFKKREVEEFATGWGGYVLWSSPGSLSLDTYSELWSNGWGIGLYPVPGRIGIFLAGRHKVLARTDPETYAREIERRLPPGPFAEALKNRENVSGAYYWKMDDCRARVWRRGRVMLLGDAADAFLPTAGIGASAAMDSAAALADELSRADADHIDYALDIYEMRQRHRVEAVQKNSRDLAGYMFVNSRFAVWMRDQLMRFYTLKRLIADISRVMARA